MDTKKCLAEIRFQDGDTFRKRTNRGKKYSNGKNKYSDDNKTRRGRRSYEVI